MGKEIGYWRHRPYTRGLPCAAFMNMPLSQQNKTDESMRTISLFYFRDRDTHISIHYISISFECRSWKSQFFWSKMHPWVFVLKRAQLCSEQPLAINLSGVLFILQICQLSHWEEMTSMFATLKQMERWTGEWSRVAPPFWPVDPPTLHMEWSKLRECCQMSMHSSLTEQESWLTPLVSKLKALQGLWLPSQQIAPTTV